MHAHARNMHTHSLKYTRSSTGKRIHATGNFIPCGRRTYYANCKVFQPPWSSLTCTHTQTHTHPPTHTHRHMHTLTTHAPVTGVHQLRVLSSKKRMRWMFSRLYHSPNTIRLRPLFSTSSLILANSCCWSAAQYRRIDTLMCIGRPSQQHALCQRPVAIDHLLLRYRTCLAIKSEGLN